MTKNTSLAGQVALVTGATRGIGKGIALQLAQAGALVYITGRTLKSTNNLGSLEQTANEIKDRGGVCIPVQVNHENDHEIAELFKKIENEQNGQLDILINNAYKGVNVGFLRIFFVKSYSYLNRQFLKLVLSNFGSKSPKYGMKLTMSA